MTGKSLVSKLGVLAPIVSLHRKVLWAVGSFSAVMNILLLVPSFYMMEVYDRVLTSRNETTLLMLSLIMLFLYGLYGAIEGVRGQSLVETAISTNEPLASDTYRRAFLLSLQSPDGAGTQALNDLATVRQFFTGSTLFAFFDAPWFPVYLLVIFMFSPWLGVFSLLSVALLVGLALLNEAVTRAPLSDANKQSLEANALAGMHFRGADMAQAMGMREALLKRWKSFYEKGFLAQQGAALTAIRVAAVTRVVRMSLQSLVLGVAAWLVLRDQLSPGMMIAASILLGRALAPVEQLIGVWGNFRQSMLALHRLNELSSKVALPPSVMDLPAPTGALTVESLSVAAPGSNVPLLTGVSFSLNPGDVLGVVGPSGAGKSTLIRGLLGLWPTPQGVVRLDGADLKAWDSERLGRHLGYVPQEVTLFSGSVAENIARMAEPSADLVLAASEAARVKELILRLPKGFETDVGVDGAMLSGGQRQRVALARALYKNPAIVVLDEPNANLDGDGEAALLAAIADLARVGKTVILVAHRQNMLSVVNKLLVLQDGLMRCFGPREEVLRHLSGSSSEPQIKGRP